MVAAAVALGATAAVAAPGDAPSSQPPWRAAEQIRSDLFTAQTDLLLSDGRSAGAEVTAARRALAGPLALGLRSGAASEMRDVRGALDAAAAAARSGNEAALAAARGRAQTALRRGAFALAVDATRRGDVAAARGWLLIRDFRIATRFTRPGVDATTALDELAAGEISPEDAVIEIRKDLLDAYQGRVLAVLAEAEQARERGFDSAFAENAAIAAGLWPLLEREYVEQRGEAATGRLGREFEALAASARAADDRRFGASLQAVRAGLDGFTAAAFTDEEQGRRASQLTRFVDLIPVEYEHGTDDGRVTIPFELQEGLAFLDGADAAFADLKGPLAQRDAAAVATIGTALVDLRRFTTDAAEGGEVVSQEEVDGAHEIASERLDEILPEEWKQSSDEADFELINISLDQMEAAIGAGEYEQAEQARLAAYAFLDFGPELKLKAFDSQQAIELEGIFWYGAAGVEGLAKQVGDHAPLSEVRETRVVLDEKLDRARATLGDGASAGTAITNSALIVFREGLEAILILAAITASLLGTRRRLRKPILRGAIAAIPASILLWVIAQAVLDSLSGYGEKLEAVVGLIAIAVLLLVLNWFFHKVYWTEWIKGHRERGTKLAEGAGAAVGAGATVLGLYLLGFSSVLREGFETVLFLQAVQLSSGTGVVVAGVALGLVVTTAVGVATFKLEQKLPYKRMLVVTGVLIALVLVTMVGNTVRVMQAVSWMPITPLDVELPLWMGTWLGIFPTVETLAAQAGALAFVIGSYYLAEWVRKRHVRAALKESVGDTRPQVLPPAGVPANGAGTNGASINGAGANGADEATPTKAGSGSSSEA